MGLSRLSYNEAQPFAEGSCTTTPPHHEMGPHNSFKGFSLYPQRTVKHEPMWPKGPALVFSEELLNKTVNGVIIALLTVPFSPLCNFNPLFFFS